MFEPPAAPSTLEFAWKTEKKLRVREGQLIQSILHVKNAGRGMTMMTAVVGERRGSEA